MYRKLPDRNLWRRPTSLRNGIFRKADRVLTANLCQGSNLDTYSIDKVRRIKNELVFTTNEKLIFFFFKFDIFTD